MPFFIISPGGDEIAINEGDSLEMVYDRNNDWIPSADGWFLESSDVRSAMSWELASAFNAWWGDSKSGSLIRRLLTSEDPAEPNDVRDEILRVLQRRFVNVQQIDSLVVNIEEDENGKPVFLLTYNDLVSGKPMRAKYTQG
jgi:hypothetical protein